ncbi:YlxR family protein [Desulfovibrio sp. OttesenSCG-928-A18]|nr:YlxR family protein [Desulfovibrio sp. OttesenSCG-928-A18]
MCVICRRRAPKSTLLRMVMRSDKAQPVPDQKQTAPGRGIYICDEPRCKEAFTRRYAKRKAKGQEI